MTLLDLALIPPFDMNGAAIASAAATLAGLAVCVVHLRREGMPLKLLVPRFAEIASLRHPPAVEPDPELARLPID